MGESKIVFKAFVSGLRTTVDGGINLVLTLPADTESLMPVSQLMAAKMQNWILSVTAEKAE